MPRSEWRALIADDEPAARRGVRQLLSAWPEWRVIGECRDGAEALAAMESEQPDAVFLDIQMPGIDGFEVVRLRTPEQMPALVFLTAYEEFALRGFEAQALDYLVKPVTVERFAKTMQRLTRYLASAPLDRTQRSPAAIMVSTARGVIRLELDEIDWIESADNYARIWTGDRSYLLRDSLQRLEERLGAAGFCRAHRGALIRLDRVRRLARTPDGGLTAILRTGREIPVSRRMRANVVERLKVASDW